MSAQNAKKCFEEIINLFSDPQTQPEKYNLYNGLYNLADEIEKINYQLQQIIQALNSVATLLQRR